MIWYTVGDLTRTLYSETALIFGVPRNVSSSYNIDRPRFRVTAALWVLIFIAQN